MTDAEIFQRVADLLDITDRDNYDCWESLAEELVDEVADELTCEQCDAVNEQVELWWGKQG